MRGLTGGALDRCQQKGVFLSSRTSFEIGGEAREFYAPGSVEELQNLCLRLRREGKRPHILGGGCNTLFPDEPFERPIISTERLREITVLGNRLLSGGGVRMDVLIRTAMKAGLAGLEFFAGIPGTTGGAVVMNAGSSGHCFGERVTRIEAIQLQNGALVGLKGSEVNWSYRSARLDGLVITSVEIVLQPEGSAAIRQRARDLLRRKAALQPLSIPSAGCIFKNAEQAPAGVLIDQAGLKGAREGGAIVSPRHANFIVNESRTASAKDVMVLLERVRTRVHNMFGVHLETEIMIPEAQ